MAADRIPRDDLQRLNALIDGESPPAEHAALAERIAADRDLAQAHATLARLKACLVEGLDPAPVPSPAPAPAAVRRPSIRFAATAAAAAIAVAVAVGIGWPTAEEEPAAHPGRAILLAALPAVPVIPDLAVGGLSLVGTEVEKVAGVSVLVAAYRGPRGCRLELRVRAAATDVPPTAGTSRRTWTAGDLTYEVAAFGMPAARFAAIADVAQAATSAGPISEPTVTRMREARRAAPPCVG